MSTNRLLSNRKIVPFGPTAFKKCVGNLTGFDMTDMPPPAHIGGEWNPDFFDVLRERHGLRMIGIAYTSQPPVERAIMGGLTRTNPPSLRSVVYNFRRGCADYDPTPEISGEVDRVFLYWFERVQ